MTEKVDPARITEISNVLKTSITAEQTEEMMKTYDKTSASDEEIKLGIKQFMDNLDPKFKSGKINEKDDGGAAKAAVAVGTEPKGDDAAAAAAKVGTEGGTEGGTVKEVADAEAALAAANEALKAKPDDDDGTLKTAVAGAEEALAAARERQVTSSGGRHRRSRRKGSKKSKKGAKKSKKGAKQSKKGGRRSSKNRRKQSRRRKH